MHLSRIKLIGRLFNEMRIIRMPYNFLPIPTIVRTFVLYDRESHAACRLSNNKYCNIIRCIK